MDFGSGGRRTAIKGNWGMHACDVQLNQGTGSIKTYGTRGASENRKTEAG